MKCNDALAAADASLRSDVARLVMDECTNAANAEQRLAAIAVDNRALHPLMDDGAVAREDGVTLRAELAKHADAMQAHAEALSADNIALRKRVAELENDAEKARGERVAMADAMWARLGEAERHVAQRAKDNDTLRTQVSKLASANEQIQVEIAKSRNEIIELHNRRLAGLSAEVEALRSRVAELERTMRQLHSDLAEMAKRRDAALMRLDDAVRHATQLAAGNTALHAQVDALEGPNTQLRGEVAKLLGEAAVRRLSGLVSEAEALRREMAERQARYCESPG